MTTLTIHGYVDDMGTDIIIEVRKFAYQRAANFRSLRLLWFYIHKVNKILHISTLNICRHTHPPTPHRYQCKSFKVSEICPISAFLVDPCSFVRMRSPASSCLPLPARFLSVTSSACGCKLSKYVYVCTLKLGECIKYQCKFIFRHESTPY